MSLTQTVIAMVRARSRASVDDLLPIEGYTRAQVLVALQNARTQGWLDCEGHAPRRGTRSGRGSVASIYIARETRLMPAPRRRKSRAHPVPKGLRLRRMQIPSVFHLGAHP
jgi:hypothetical protein